MKKTLFFLVAVSFLLSAQSASAAKFPSFADLLPDSHFYFLKTWQEKISIFFTAGEENKASQYIHLADVRLAEYQKMIEKGKTEIAQKTLEKYGKQLDSAYQKIEELKNKGKDVKDISQKLGEALAKHAVILEENLQKVPESGREGIEKALDNSKKGIEKITGKTEQERICTDSGGTVATSSCCQSAGDFPGTCLIGSCGCSPDSSHEVKTCDCGEGKCFDGTKCKNLVSEPESQCWNLWYLDNDHRFCQEREFCGMYMYLGLYTFGTKGECESVLSQQ